jgi:hypothetical protein
VVLVPNKSLAAKAVNGTAAGGSEITAQ